MLLVPRATRNVFLGRLLKSEATRVHLYISDTWPEDATSLDDLTEARGFDYGPKILGPGDWTIREGEATAPALSWVFSGMLGRIVGYYVTGVESGILYWVERFGDGPYRMEANGDGVTVDPRFALGPPR